MVQSYVTTVMNIPICHVVNLNFISGKQKKAKLKFFFENKEIIFLQTLRLLRKSAKSSIKNNKRKHFVLKFE